MLKENRGDFIENLSSIDTIFSNPDWTGSMQIHFATEKIFFVALELGLCSTQIPF